MSDNKIRIEFQSKSQNEGFARVAIAAFISQLDPTIEEITDVKTAVVRLFNPILYDIQP